MGPIVSSDRDSGVTPCVLTRPRVGLMPTTPHTDDGMRIDPPVSVPSAPRQSSAASAAPEPPDEPPTIRVGSWGLRVGPKWALLVLTPNAHSWSAVFPTRI